MKNPFRIDPANRNILLIRLRLRTPDVSQGADQPRRFALRSKAGGVAPADFAGVLRDSTDVSSWSFIGLMAIAGIFILMLSTREGIGVSPDSVTYIQGARNILNGDGFSATFECGQPTAITHYPPLFSVLLAAIGCAGVDPLDGARMLNAFLFGVNIFLVGYLLLKYTRSMIMALLGSLITLLSVCMLQVHAMAWSEPLFIAWTLISLLILAEFLRTRRWRDLAGASLAVALAFLTRYAGVALIWTGLAGILILSRESFSLNRKVSNSFPPGFLREPSRGAVNIVHELSPKTIFLKRFRDATLFAAMAIGPMLLWMMKNFYSTGNLINRDIVFHPLTKAHGEQLAMTISTWFFPQGPVVLMALLAILMLTVYTFLQSSGPIIPRLISENESRSPATINFVRLLIIFILMYVLNLGLARSLFDAYILIDFRILSPLFPVGLVLVFCLLSEMGRSLKDARVLNVLSVVIGLAMVVSYAIPFESWSRDLYSPLWGYASYKWRGSNIVEKVRSLAEGTIIYTNGPDAVYILAGREAIKLPSKVNPTTRKINPQYLEQLADMETQLKKNSGVLVYFNRLSWRGYLPSQSELKGLPGLTLLEQCPDGAIYVFLSDRF